MEDATLRTRIRDIMQDENLTETEKSEARQELLMGNTKASLNLDDTFKKSTPSSTASTSLSCVQTPVRKT